MVRSTLEDGGAHSTFSPRIAQVVGLRADEQVIRSYAAGVVAMVADDHTLGDCLPAGQFNSKPVRLVLPSSGSNLAVPASI
jgi:hypothetical protein